MAGFLFVETNLLIFDKVLGDPILAGLLHIHVVDLAADGRIFFGDGQVFEAIIFFNAALAVAIGDVFRRNDPANLLAIFQKREIRSESLAVGGAMLGGDVGQHAARSGIPVVYADRRG